MTPPVDSALLLKARRRHTVLAAILALPLLAVSRPQWAADGLAFQALFWLGQFLIVLGVCGRIYASCFVGGRKNQEIVRDGPFGVVRNPLYVASFMGLIGVGLSSGMASVAAGLALAFALYYPAVVAREEAFLAASFGQAYDDYRRQVPRWWPDWSRWNLPESVPMNPVFPLRTLRDGLWFLAAGPLFAALRAAQDGGFIPIYFVLP
ncbi:MAG: isoprenylcysteine carboxylmethyltransferase family protein [Alphaproteobacteria bacterium]|nr:isoprenylcysteine carboxylmethyltransferase family protein [Alphaproteobacteria bacterium]